MAFCITSFFDEIFNNFEAAKTRKLYLSSWIITSKTLQFFSAKLVLVGVKQQKIPSALWTLQQNFEIAVVLSFYIFEHQISYSLLRRRFILHIFVYRCQNCNVYCITNITKIQNRHQKLFNIGGFTFVQEAWHSEISQKLHRFIVLHSSIWGLWALFAGLSPQSPTWRRDCKDH